MRIAVAMIAVGLMVQSCTVEKVSPETPVPGTTPVAPVAAITTSSGIAMVDIPGGEFKMGQDGGQDDERPVHAVRISAFQMDVYEVTQEAHQKLMGTNPAKHKNPKQPVEQVGWFGALKYCNMRSLKEGLTPCYDLGTLQCDYSANGYRLPTEAEWEYACRAGADGEYSMAGGGKLGEAAWFEDNAGGAPHPVGEKKPNAWGLFDMHGNVYEWCNDDYSDTYYGASPASDPCNFGSGEEKVLRGGAWNSDSDSCRATARYSEAPGLADVCFGYDAFGFRCVRRASGAAAVHE